MTQISPFFPSLTATQFSVVFLSWKNLYHDIIISSIRSNKILSDFSEKTLQVVKVYQRRVSDFQTVVMDEFHFP